MARAERATGGSIGAGRAEVVVVIPVFGAPRLFERCLASVLAHSREAISVIVADDATPGEEIAAIIAAVDSRQRVLHLRQPSNVGFVANVNAAFDAAGHGDVVVVNSDCVVATGWLEGLDAAAHCDSRVATASALTNNGTIVSVPERNRPAAAPPGGMSVDEAAAAVRSGSLRLRPRLPTAIGHCFYVRRTALELVGGFDEAFSPGYGEEVDFSQRCLRNGLIHVLADDVYVFHSGRGSFGERADLQAAHERLIARRYPYYHAAVRTEAEAARGPLADALGAARRALSGLSVTVDASAIGPIVAGTQVATLELIRALAERDDLSLRVVIASAIAAPARAVIEGLGVELLLTHEIERGVPASDVVHRPSQVFEPKHLDWLNRLGERIVITHQDLIAYDNPTYFESHASFDEHRSLTRRSLALADAVAFISEHVRADALARELIAAERAHVVAQGTDHRSEALPAAPQGFAETSFLLCLGTDFHHKNRLFALRMLAELRRGGFEGRLVLAGPRAWYGSSREDEDRYLAEHPQLAGAVVRLGEVSDAEKGWLYEHAALVLYPTVSEGFGLVPFEAAAAGTACMFAPQTSLDELLPPASATLVAWDATASATAARRLLDDRSAREELIALVQARARELTWARTAAGLAEVYRGVCTRPSQAARAAYFGEGLSDTGLSLVGPGGYVPPDVQRALLAVATRPALRRPLFTTLAGSYRVLRRIQRSLAGKR